MIKLTWLGCAAFIIDLDGTRLMFDPFFYRQENENASPKLKTNKEDIGNIHAIFIIHGYFDHITDAGWFAENKNIPVYGSAVAKENIINWAEGKILEEMAHEFTDKGKNNLHTVKAEDIVKINNEITVEVLKSNHIRFDAETIMARLKNKDFRKQMKSLIPLKHLTKGDVYAYCIHFKGKKIVIYGSLYEKFKDILKKFEDCDIFIAPLAGNSATHIAKKMAVMIDLLKPKIVIPTHWDDFWPPVSRFEDLGPFHEYMKKSHPDIQIIKLEIDTELIIHH